MCCVVRKSRSFLGMWEVGGVSGGRCKQDKQQMHRQRGPQRRNLCSHTWESQTRLLEGTHIRTVVSRKYFGKAGVQGPCEESLKNVS